MTNGAQENNNRYKIDFIDPLFAVAIHIGFVEGLLMEDWLRDRKFPTSLNEVADILMFIAALGTLVMSWVGYHLSINNKAIQGISRFVLDVVILVFYILLLLYFREPSAMAILMVLIFVTYVLWDRAKTMEYPVDYYGRQDRIPNVLQFISVCWRGWWEGRRGSPLIGEIVTFGWTIFYLALLPLTFLPANHSVTAKFAFAPIFLISNLLYRLDKGNRNRGYVICSIPAKLFLLSMLAYALLFYSGVLAEVQYMIETFESK